MEADHKIHSGWGDSILWFNQDFKDYDLNTDSIPVSGFAPPGKTPEVGQTLIGEFEKSSIKFEFVSVRKYDDPTDQFSGKVVAVEQDMKDSYQFKEGLLSETTITPLPAISSFQWKETIRKKICKWLQLEKKTIRKEDR